MALLDVEGVPVHLGEIIVENLMASWQSVQDILVRHYSRQLLHELYKVNMHDTCSQIVCHVFQKKLYTTLVVGSSIQNDLIKMQNSKCLWSNIFLNLRLRYQ
jgi:hypothetical protein